MHFIILLHGLCGCAGGRWRCAQYFVRRARLSLAMMEQLDIMGRTGEMARAFGIDFFSVLTRGSQYRVEAMMARLAHTQNYLLPAPSVEQVHSASSIVNLAALAIRYCFSYVATLCASCDPFVLCQKL